MRKHKLLLIALASLLAMPVPVSAENWSKYRIMIDPGHGGSDPGASGPSAPHEATLALRCAKALAEKFSSLGAPYKLTRTTDATLSLSARRDMSVSYDPYIFCSIHLNAYNGSANGTETWYYHSAGNSQSLANKVQASLVSQLGRVNRGVKQNGWTVITGSSSVPAILTEGLFVDNYTEWSMIKDQGSSGFNKWVNGHLYGFYDHLTRFSSTITNPRTGTGSGTSTPEPDPTPAPTPTLSINNTSWAFTCDEGGYATATFTATKTNTTAAINVTSNNSAFIVNKVTAFDGGAWFDIRFLPPSAGTFSGVITVTCGSLSKTLSVTGTAREVLVPSMSLNTESWAYTCKSNDNVVATFTATLNNTTGTVSASSSSPAFVVTKVSQHSNNAGAWIDVKFAPTAPGSYSGVITVTSGSLSRNISVTGQATPEDLRFDAVWNFSDKMGTTTYRDWDATKVRNMTYKDGKLYMVYEQKDIKVINARTGEEIGNLNKINLSGGTVDVADVKCCDGKIVASNIAIASSDDALRVYTWENDQTNPGLLLETRDFGGAPRIGDCIGWRGTWENGELVFCNDDGTTTRLITYAITNGHASKTPTVIELKTQDGNRLETGGSTRPYPQSDGGYWITGRDSHTTYVNVSGVRNHYIEQDVTWGNAFAHFNFKGTKYGLYTTYEDPSGESLGSQTSEQRAQNYTKGRVRLVRPDNGWSKPITIFDYPYNGFSDTRQNINCTSNVVINVEGDRIEMWTHSTNQGMAYFITHGDTPPSDGDIQEIENTMPVILPAAPNINITGKAGMTSVGSLTFAHKRLRGDISLHLEGADADLFLLSTNTISKNDRLETLKIFYSPSAVGNHECDLVATSSNAETVTVKVTAQATNNTNLNHQVGELRTNWIFSENTNNFYRAPWFDTTSRPSRDFCLANGILYVLNSNSFSSNPEIHGINAYGGEKKFDVDMSGISGGEIEVASVNSLGGNLLASNAARSAGYQDETETDVLHVYFWADRDAAPELWLRDAYHGGIHVGEKMSTYGDMSEGMVMFSDGSKVLIYDVDHGTAAQDPRIIDLTKDGNPYPVSDIKGSVSVSMLDDGSFWVTGKNCFPTRFDASGEYIETFKDDAIAGSCFGTDATFFDFGDRKYMVAATYLNKTNPSNHLTEGALAVVDCTNGIHRAYTTCTYPEAGLGPTVNSTFQSTVAHEISNDGERLNLWVMMPYQGIAFFKVNAADNQWSGIDGVEADRSGAATKLFNLHGQPVTSGNPVPGVYINVDGEKIEKILIH